MFRIIAWGQTPVVARCRLSLRIARKRTHASTQLQPAVVVIAAIRRTEFMERPAAGHSGLSPANFTTLAHFSVSSAMNFPKSAGEPDNAVPPRSARRALNLGSARAALISRLSLSTISAGVFFGVPTPLQKLDS